MTKEQAEEKLALLPLLTTVTVSYAEDAGVPYLQYSYSSIPGPGTTNIGVDLVPTAAQLQDCVNNLPLAPENRLAALAIMLAPVVVP
jgi:hypothetical protein